MITCAPHVPMEDVIVINSESDDSDGGTNIDNFEKVNKKVVRTYKSMPMVA